jgi:hypothetical protein
MLPRDSAPKRVVKHAGGRPLIDLAGQQFGKLLVVERAEKPAQYSLSATSGTWWRCNCDCGAEVILHSRRIRQSAWVCRCHSQC